MASSTSPITSLRFVFIHKDINGDNPGRGEGGRGACLKRLGYRVARWLVITKYIYTKTWRPTRTRTPTSGYLKVSNWLMYLSLCNLNIPNPPGNNIPPPPGIWTFRFLAVKFPSPSSKKLFKCPTYYIWYWSYKSAFLKFSIFVSTFWQMCGHFLAIRRLDKSWHQLSQTSTVSCAVCPHNNCLSPRWFVKCQT